MEKLINITIIGFNSVPIIFTIIGINLDDFKSKINTCVSEHITYNNNNDYIIHYKIYNNLDLIYDNLLFIDNYNNKLRSLLNNNDDILLTLVKLDDINQIYSLFNKDLNLFLDFKNNYYDFSRFYKKDPNKVLLFIENNTENINEDLMEILISYGYATILNKFKDNYLIVLQIVKNDGIALKNASDKFKTDKTIVLEAFKQNRLAIIFASNELMNDKESIIEFLKINIIVLQFVNKELKKDKELFLEFVKINGYALQFANIELRSDKQLVLEAVKRNGRALQFVNTILRSDKDVIKEAVKQNDIAIKFAIEK